MVSVPTPSVIALKGRIVRDPNPKSMASIRKHVFVVKTGSFFVITRVVDHHLRMVGFLNNPTPTDIIQEITRVMAPGDTLVTDETRGLTQESVDQLVAAGVPVAVVNPQRSSLFLTHGTLLSLRIARSLSVVLFETNKTHLKALSTSGYQKKNSVERFVESLVIASGVPSAPDIALEPVSDDDHSDFYEVTDQEVALKLAERRKKNTDLVRFFTRGSDFCLVAVDASTSEGHQGHNRSYGAGIVTSDGDFYQLSFSRKKNPPDNAELRAMAEAVTAMHESHNKRFLFLSDNINVVNAANEYLLHGRIRNKGKLFKSATINQFSAAIKKLFTKKKAVAFAWVPGHNGDPLNEAAHSIALRTTRLSRGENQFEDSARTTDKDGSEKTVRGTDFDFCVTRVQQAMNLFGGYKLGELEKILSSRIIRMEDGKLYRVAGKRIKRKDQA